MGLVPSFKGRKRRFRDGAWAKFFGSEGGHLTVFGTDNKYFLLLLVVKAELRKALMSAR